MNLAEQQIDGLRDIHLPDAISWWPPAIGWWILLALVIAAIIFIPKIYRRMTFTPLKKVASLTFNNIIERHKKNNDDMRFIIETSQFLRQTAMSYYGREDVAQLTGEKWVQVLNDLTEQTHFNDELKQTLINAPYQKNSPIDVQHLIEVVKNWLKNLPIQEKGLNK